MLILIKLQMGGSSSKEEEEKQKSVQPPQPVAKANYSSNPQQPSNKNTEKKPETKVTREDNKQ